MSKPVYHTCRVVRIQEIPSDATIIQGPLILDEGTYHFLCGDCGGIIVRGYDLARGNEYVRDKRGCFVACQKCSAHNQVSSPKMT
jgi:hypothetical protein